MPASMPTWEELPVEEMTWNLLHTHSFSFIEGGYHGKDIRYADAFGINFSLYEFLFNHLV